MLWTQRIGAFTEKNPEKNVLSCIMRSCQHKHDESVCLKEQYHESDACAVTL